jgi:hypothetical protein
VQSNPTLDLDALARAVAERLAPLLRAEAERLLDRPQIAARLGVAERTVSGLVARGDLPPALLHTGGVARWSWGQVVKHLEGRQGRQRRKGRGRYQRPSAEQQ